LLYPSISMLIVAVSMLIVAVCCCAVVAVIVLIHAYSHSFFQMLRTLVF
jgi:hypothetical protein